MSNMWCCCLKNLGRLRPRGMVEYISMQCLRVFNIANGVDGAQDVIGWPSWLTIVAREAIKGWFPQRADSFEKLDKIGQGPYNSVYRARDRETGNIVALQRISSNLTFLKPAVRIRL